MELIFCWSNPNSALYHNLLADKSFNFSPEYACSFNQNTTKLQIDTIHRKTLLKNDFVMNITAIVGQNGSGKSTILKYLFENTAYVNGINTDILDSPNSEYIFIFANQNNRIKIIHNNDIEVIQNLNLEEKDCNNNLEVKWKYLKEDISPIYITNSQYTPFESSSFAIPINNNGTPTGALLSPAKLRQYSDDFYTELIEASNTSDSNQSERIKDFQNNLKKAKTENKFQQIVDVMFLQYLDEQKNKNYFGEIRNELKIDFISIDSIFSGKSSPYNINDVVEIIKKINQTKVFQTAEWQKGIYAFRIYSYLYIEMKINGFECNDDIINNLAQLSKELGSYLDGNRDNKKTILGIFPALNSQIAKWAQNSSNNYYKNAANEIEKFLDIFQKDTKRTIFGAYVIDRSKNREQYQEVLKFITDAAKTKKSFLLKYIEIGNLGMSSGERAVQNMFSWLYFLMHGSKYKINGLPELAETILLLIDEIDLYLHPEWQRKITKFLLDELLCIFENKKIQLIMATHSPILLSDIPKENIIYLKEGCKVSDQHKQTFGANIHAILKDSFFLESLVGEFAKFKIQEAIDNINTITEDKKTITEDKIEEMQQALDYIGDPLIQRKLQEKLYTVIESKCKLEMLEKQRELIEKEIEKLEKENKGRKE